MIARNMGLAALTTLLLAGAVGAEEKAKAADGDPPVACAAGIGPQSPRHLDSLFVGQNNTPAPPAPPVSGMNLCNIHFHRNAEHRSFGFINPARTGGVGYECSSTNYMREAQVRPFVYSAARTEVCEKIAPGQTIEMHWVFTSCNIEKPRGGGLAEACGCVDAKLRVESQVFLLVNHDEDAAGLRPEVPPGLGEVETFRSYGSIYRSSAGFYQPERLPGGPSEAYAGSTTGGKFNGKDGSADQCSRSRVGWNVRTGCRTLDIRSLHDWCASPTNLFSEDGRTEAHSARKLVEQTDLLATMR